MKVTQIRFSHATEPLDDSETSTERLALFSAEFDHQLLIHKLYLTKNKNAKGYYLVLPKSDVPFKLISSNNQSRSRPRVYFTDKELFNELLDISIEMYKELISQYNGRYDRKIDGTHEKITVETALHAIEQKNEVS